MPEVTVTLVRDLNQFPVANTSSRIAGVLKAGGPYPVVAIETRGTDEYVQVGTWICAKSNGIVYATLGTPVEPIVDGISELALTTYLQKFNGYVYSSGSPKYTAPLPNIIISLEPPKQDNCCTFVEDLVVHAFQAANWVFHWDQVRHEQLMVADWSAIWTPPHGVADAGLALPVQGPSVTLPLPRPWSLCQGWGTSGHTFIVVAIHTATRKVLILESTNGWGLNGPGLRGLGPVAMFPNGPPADWWTRSGVPTWEDLCTRYSTGIALAQLKVITSTLVWGKGG